MTLKHSKVQGNIYYAWRLYTDQHKLGGEVYTEAPCSTADSEVTFHAGQVAKTQLALPGSASRWTNC